MASVKSFIEGFIKIGFIIAVSVFIVAQIEELFHPYFDNAESSSRYSDAENPPQNTAQLESFQKIKNAVQSVQSEASLIIKEYKHFKSLLHSDSDRFNQVYFKTVEQFSLSNRSDLQPELEQVNLDYKNTVRSIENKLGYIQTDITKEVNKLLQCEKSVEAAFSDSVFSTKEEEFFDRSCIKPISKMRQNFADIKLRLAELKEDYLEISNDSVAQLKQILIKIVG